MAVKFLNGIDVDGSMNIAASDVPNLDASKITSGTLSADRIPNLSGVYQPAGDYLTLETAETSFQPLGNYLTGISSADVTAALGYVPYQEGTTLSASTIVVSNIEKSNITLDGQIGWDANDSSPAPAYLGSYGGSNPDGLYFKGSGTIYTVYHTGHFSGTNIANWETAYGWGNHASAGYLTSLPSHNHDTLYDTIGSADAVNARIDNEVFPALDDLGNAIPTNNNQLTNGAGYITSVPAEYLTQTEGDARYLRLSGGVLSGNLEVGATNKTSDTVVRSLADQNYKAGFEAYGNGQGTGYFYAGQSNSYGGGFSYNGDGSPAFINNEDSDHITFFRRAAGVNSEVFHYSYNSNDVYFNGAITVSGGNSNQWNTAYGWGNHASAGYLTSIPSSYATDAEVSSAVAAVEASINERIDTQVFDAIATVDGNIPTNNNQLTNGAGYITQANGDARYAGAGKGNAHTSFSDLNSNPTLLGWTYYQGTTNSPHNGNQGGYKLRVGLGSDYGTNTGSSGHYAMEMLMPRTTQATSGVGYLYMRQMENGAWDSWSKIKAGYADSTPWSGITGKPTLATESYVDTAVSNLVDSAPGALNTLNELAAALGDDANFSTTVTNNIAAVNDRIDTEVFDAIATVDGNIPTNNNQLTNGAGYITAVPSSFSANSITIGGGATLTESTDRADLLMIKSSTSSWGGLQVSNTSNEGIISLMINGNEGGLYDDQNGEWILKSTENGGLTLGYNNVTKLTTTSTGITITGEIVTTGGNSTNWNTAYGWGNHASAGYLTSIPSSYATDAEVSSAVAAIETSINDRIDTEVLPAIDSKLDSTAKAADSNLLDGINSTSFLRSDQNDTMSGVLTITGNNGVSKLRLEGTTPTIDLDDADGDSFYIHVNSNNFYVLADRDGGGNYGTWEGPHPLQLEADTNRTFLWGNLVGNAAYASTSDFATSAQGTKADTAHGWGNHASAGYLKSIPSTYVQQTQDIVSGNIHPVGDREQLLGLDSNRWQVVFCEILDSAGQHEKNLQNPEGEKSVGEYETGTVLVWKDGKNIPCTEPADHMRMGVAVQGVASPLIQGAEPVLVTGTVNEGDYLVTSSVEGHAKAISPQFMRQHGLYDCVLGKALESGEGESYLLKTWINI